jgi:hypothetical protein
MTRAPVWGNCRVFDAWPMPRYPSSDTVVPPGSQSERMIIEIRSFVAELLNRVKWAVCSTYPTRP